MQVALIDDDDQTRKILARLLRKMGVEVATEAGDGMDGLRRLAGSVAQVIITDCQMPRMDGMAMARALRARGDGRPIVMLSGLSDGAVVQAALGAGVTRYLTKPVDEGVLLETLYELTAREQAA